MPASPGSPYTAATKCVIVAAAEHNYTTADLVAPQKSFRDQSLFHRMTAIGLTVMPPTGSSWIAVVRWRPRPACLPRGGRPPGGGADRESRRRGEREPGRDARMPPGLGTGLRDGRAAGRVPAVPGRSGAGRRTPARNHRAGRGSGRRPDARERRGGAGRCGPGSPGYRRVRLPGASRPVVPSR
jgi:hypothetical protein